MRPCGELYQHVFVSPAEEPSLSCCLQVRVYYTYLPTDRQTSKPLYEQDNYPQTHSSVLTLRSISHHSVVLHMRPGAHTYPKACMNLSRLRRSRGRASSAITAKIYTLSGNRRREADYPRGIEAGWGCLIERR